jgi:hypothetical protein
VVLARYTHANNLAGKVATPHVSGIVTNATRAVPVQWSVWFHVFDTTWLNGSVLALRKLAPALLATAQVYDDIVSWCTAQHALHTRLAFAHKGHVDYVTDLRVQVRSLFRSALRRNRNQDSDTVAPQVVIEPTFVTPFRDSLASKLRVRDIYLDIYLRRMRKTSTPILQNLLSAQDVAQADARTLCRLALRHGAGAPTVSGQQTWFYLGQINM